MIPLSQSKQALMACPHSYAEQIIQNRPGWAGSAAHRGSTVHQFLKEYAEHLVNASLEQDLRWFDVHGSGLEPEALEILEGIRESFKIDPDNVAGAELNISLDESFKPAGEPPFAYDMTLDLLTINAAGTEARIDDYKTNFRAFEADTFQAKLYALGVFALSPAIETVIFRLQFVRWNRPKETVFHRSKDLEQLQAEAGKWRQFQKAIHLAPAGPHDVNPGAHCSYCPLLANGCPIERNPFVNPLGQLRNVVYFRQALKRAEQAVRAEVDHTGPLEVTDSLGTTYRAEFKPKEKRHYSLDGLPAILEWEKRTRETILPKLNISGLSSLLKAKKRAELKDTLANFVEVEFTTDFHVGIARDGEEEEEETNGQ